LESERQEARLSVQQRVNTLRGKMTEIEADRLVQSAVVAQEAVIVEKGGRNDGYECPER
jgi:hypothetical protein